MSDVGALRPSDDARPVVAVFRSPAFNASEGFIQAQTAGLVRYQPMVVAMERKGNVVPALEGRILFPRSRWERLRLSLLGDAGPAASRLQGAAPLLIHAHFGTDGLMALPLARELGIPLITTLRGYDVTRSTRAMLLSGRIGWLRYALFKNRLMRQGMLFLAVSEALRRKAVAQGYPADRIVTHYNGVDLARFRPDGEPIGKLILHVGRLVEKKGTALLLRAFAAVAAVHPDARLVIVGDGPLRSRLEEESRRTGLAASVRFAGALGRDEVSRWMQQAWVLACPSLTARDGDAEGLPNTVVEGAACGLPVVASRHSGIPEAVIDGVTGFLVPEADGFALAAKLLEMLESPERRAQMSSAARTLAETKFDFRRQMEALERIYDEVVARAPRRGLAGHEAMDSVA